MRLQLKSDEKISISDDFSPEMEMERSQLYPVMRAIKEKMPPEHKSKVSLRNNQLVLHGKAYGVHDLHLLPSEFDTHNLFTPSHNNMTAFYTKNSVLSNHYSCKFQVHGIQYSSMEQYLFSTLTELFSDQETLSIEHENDPMKSKGLGKKIKNFDSVTWCSRIDEILKKG